jgi:hypothetical protein
VAARRGRARQPPTIKQLNTDPRFFPYRYGQALWAYVGGRWGDRAVVDVYRTSLRIGFEEGIRRVLGVSTDSLSKDWISATRRAYLPVLEGRTRPNGAGDPVLQTGRRSGDMALAPTVSPTGSSSRTTRGAACSRSSCSSPTRRRAARSRSSRARRATRTSTPSASSTRRRVVARQPKVRVRRAGRGQPRDRHLDVNSARSNGAFACPGVGSVTHIAWSPNGQTIAFSGMAGGISDLYLLDLAGRHRPAAHERPQRGHPAGRGRPTEVDRLRDRSRLDDRLGQDGLLALQLATIDVASGQVSVFSPFTQGKHINPQYSPDGKSLFFIAIRTDSATSTGSSSRAARSHASRAVDGVSGITAISPALTVGADHRSDALLGVPGSGLRRVRARLARTRGEPARRRSRRWRTRECFLPATRLAARR